MVAPRTLEWANYSRAWSESRFGAAALNTLLVVALASLLIVAWPRRPRTRSPVPGTGRAVR